MVPNMKKIITILALLLIICITTYINKPNNSLKDDYYDYINKDILKKHKLKENEYTWNTFSSMQDKVDNRRDNIIKELISKRTNSNLNILYSNILDTNKRNKEGIDPLKKYISRIDNSNNIKEYINNAIYIENTLHIDIFTNIKVDKDFKNTSKNIIYLYPITMDFGTSADYYVNEDYMSYKALIKQYGIKIMNNYGYDKKKSRSISNDITNMFIDISNNSKLSKDLEDISSYYNIITINDLKKIYTNLDIDNYLKSKNIKETKFSIVDINNYKTINSYLTNDNLSLLKEYTKLKILESYSPYLSDNYSNLLLELNNKLQGINMSKDTKEDIANDIISNYFTYDIDSYYQDKYLSKEDYKYIENMIKEIISYYKKDINNLKWLSPTTKEKAIDKLNNMTINIGMPNDYINYTKDYNLSESNSLIDNIILIGNTINNYELSKIKTNNKSIELSGTTVNAYYNPRDNSINFPSAFSIIYNKDNNYYQNLGTIGMIIAHEITHAFDENGRKFDSSGNISNWWKDIDLNNYKKIQKKVINYYNKYEVSNGNYINGKRTVNENIADLGAISCISNIAKSKNATSKDIKTMYSSLAKMWASISNKEYENMLLLQDTHSPSKYRVNATLSSTELFYKTYNITILDKMYIPTNDRVKVW